MIIRLLAQIYGLLSGPTARLQDPGDCSICHDDGVEPWSLIESRPGSAGYVTVRVDHYRLADGTECEWDILTGPDTVAVLALTDEHQIVLARQFRPGPGLILDELPGGLIDPGESVADAAARELAEETGFVGQIEVVGSTWSAGNATRRCWVAVATQCRPATQQRLDDAEQIEVVRRDLGEFRRQLRDGALTDSALAYRGLEFLGEL
jgi:ADP-ribose pyrophosphatase